MTNTWPALDPALSARILGAVDQGFEAQVRFTQELIRYPSLRGQEHTAQEYYFQELRRRGYAMDRFTIDVREIEDHPGFSPVKVSFSASTAAMSPASTTSMSWRRSAYIRISRPMRSRLFLDEFSTLVPVLIRPE